MDTDLSAISGNASPSDWDLLTGGGYSWAQDPATAMDNGTVNNSSTGTGTASNSGTVAPPAGGASYTPPAFLQTLSSLATTFGQAATAVSPIINGKPVTSPAAAGSPAPTTGATVQIGGSMLSSKMIMIIVAVVAGYFLLFRRRRA